MRILSKIPKNAQNWYKMILKGIENVHIFLGFVHILGKNPFHIFCTLAGSTLLPVKSIKKNQIIF